MDLFSKQTSTSLMLSVFSEDISTLDSVYLRQKKIYSACSHYILKRSTVYLCCSTAACDAHALVTPHTSPDQMVWICQQDGKIILE